MKPGRLCSCQNGNPNCYLCGGWGEVREEDSKAVKNTIELVYPDGYLSSSDGGSKWVRKSLKPAKAKPAKVLASVIKVYGRETVHCPKCSYLRNR